jgi:hypothetical protein
LESNETNVNETNAKETIVAESKVEETARVTQAQASQAEIRILEHPANTLDRFPSDLSKLKDWRENSQVALEIDFEKEGKNSYQARVLAKSAVRLIEKRIRR